MGALVLFATLFFSVALRRATACSICPMVFAARSTTFTRCIQIVIQFGTKAEMGRIHARRIIARMHHYKAFWNRAFVEFVRIAMRPSLEIGSWHHDDAVAEVISATRPLPASRIFLYISRMKDIFRTQNRMFIESAANMELIVVKTTKPSCNRWFATKRAFQLFFGMVCHDPKYMLLA